MLAGRYPTWSGDPAQAPDLLTLESPLGEISRNHLLVTVQGWEVLVTDLSTNGTFVTAPDGTVRWLDPDVPLRIPDGTVITVAATSSLRYDARR